MRNILTTHGPAVILNAILLVLIIALAGTVPIWRG